MLIILIRRVFISILSSAQVDMSESEQFSFSAPNESEQTSAPDAMEKKRRKPGRTTFTRKKGKGHGSMNPPSNDSAEELQPQQVLHPKIVMVRMGSFRKLSQL